MNDCKFLNDRIFFYERRNIKHKKAVEFAFRDLRRLAVKNIKRLYPKADPNVKEDELPF